MKEKGKTPSDGICQKQLRNQLKELSMTKAEIISVRKRMVLNYTHNAKQTTLINFYK